ncbi:MAG: histidine kinase [Anaerocolumna sp.]
MKKIKRNFSSLKLSHKFTFFIMVIIVFPMVILLLLFFENIKDSKIKEKMKNVELNFTQNYNQIQKNVEMCQMSAQVMVNSQNFWNYVSRFCQHEDFKTEQLLNFYQTEIKALEKIVNTNPYLYQIRVYADFDNIPEMMPILYRKDRMKRLAWAKNGEPESGTWQFDYTDELFPAYSVYGSDHLVSLVTQKPLGNGKNAVIEVSTKMELMFPQIYSPTEAEWTCFVDGEGKYYFDPDYNCRWFDDIGDVLHKMPGNLDDISYDTMSLDGEQVVVCYKNVKELKGYLFRIVSLKDDLAAVNSFRNIFLGCFIVIVIILIFVSDKMVNIILKQFYVIMDTVRMVQKGDLEVRIPTNRDDEIGELGQQINKMLNRINRLMGDNIKREVLVKNTEIRALQNQINAHFIYNVLESIKMMAEVDEKYEISDAVTALGKLLRYSMKWVSKNVTVGDEIDYIKNYLALINLRFDYEIYLSLNIPDIMYGQEIPKMSLQPIIENAIYHGIEELAEDTSIYMKGIIYEKYCTIEITDAGRGMTEEKILELKRKIEGEVETTGSSGNGIGLKNVQDRIKISFGEEYGISIVSKKDCYTKVIVKIPFNTENS